jgi:hypothetical protein
MADASDARKRKLSGFNLLGDRLILGSSQLLPRPLRHLPGSVAAAGPRALRTRKHLRKRLHSAPPPPHARRRLRPKRPADHPSPARNDVRAAPPRCDAVPHSAGPRMPLILSCAPAAPCHGRRRCPRRACKAAHPSSQEVEGVPCSRNSRRGRGSARGRGCRRRGPVIASRRAAAEEACWTSEEEEVGGRGVIHPLTPVNATAWSPAFYCPHTVRQPLLGRSLIDVPITGVVPIYLMLSLGYHHHDPCHHTHFKAGC